jgi:hypothetical protein
MIDEGHIFVTELFDVVVNILLVSWLQMPKYSGITTGVRLMTRSEFFLFATTFRSALRTGEYYPEGKATRARICSRLHLVPKFRRFTSRKAFNQYRIQWVAKSPPRDMLHCTGFRCMT